MVQIKFDKNDDDISESALSSCANEGKDGDRSRTNSPYRTPPKTPRGLSLTFGGTNNTKTQEFEGNLDGSRES